MVSHRDVVNRNARKMAEKYPEKVIARATVNHAVVIGKLPPAKTQKCVHCGEKAREYHHHKGYDIFHIMDVVPVCKKCHVLVEKSKH